MRMTRGGGEHPLTVAVRVRPMTEQEIIAGGTQIAHPVDKQVMQSNTQTITILIFYCNTSSQLYVTHPIQCAH